MEKDFSQEQEELRKRPTITIMPAFNNEWVIEVHDCNGDLQGRFNAEDGEVAVHAIRSALTERNDSTDFGIN